MKSLLKHGNLNEGIRTVTRPDGSVATIHTKHDAEAALITHGSKPTKSGSTFTDLHVHLADGSKVNAEVKAGTNVDLAQMTVNMDPEAKKVAFSGPIAAKAKAGLEANSVAKRIMNHMGRRVGGDINAHHRAAQELSSQHHASLTDKHKEYTDRNLEAARAAHAASNPNDQAFQEFNQKNALNAAKQESIKQINRDHPEQAQYVHTSSKEIQPLTGMASSMAHLTGRFGTGLGKTEPRKKMDNRMVHDFLHNYEDPIQKHIHQKTGEIAVFPVSNEHRKHTDQMGLKGQVSLEDIVNHPEERRSSLGVMSRLRRKEKRGNLSVTGDSSKFVDAVKRRGGTVFANADEYKAHATEHGYQVRSGQFPNETVNEETSVMKDVVSKLLEYSGPQFQDKMVNQDLNTERDEDSGSVSLTSGTGMRGIYSALGGAAAGALRDKKEVKPEVKKDDKNDSGKTTPQETDKPSNTPPNQEPVRAEPSPVTVSDDEKKNSRAKQHEMNQRSTSPVSYTRMMMRITRTMRSHKTKIQMPPVVPTQRMTSRQHRIPVTLLPVWIQSQILPHSKQSRSPQECHTKLLPLPVQCRPCSPVENMTLSRSSILILSKVSLVVTVI